MSVQEDSRFEPDLLNWYDSHKRTLPWRAKEEGLSDPYRVWLSEVMLQQTTVQAVIPYYLRFLELWPDLESLAEADPDSVMQEWAGLGYYARARNLLKCARTLVREHKGQFPRTQTELKTLPGIGDYTSGAISAIAFNLPATALDANAERVLARYFGVQEPFPRGKAVVRELAEPLYKSANRPSAFVQAMMDLGAGVCKPNAPLCAECPLASECKARIVGNPEALPRREEKSVKPTRYGYVFWLEDSQGRILFQKRPEKGLLGGMIGLPTTDWTETDWPAPVFPGLEAMEVLPDQEVRHTFTHFHLRLRGVRGSLGNVTVDSSFFQESRESAKTLGFPTLFRKTLSLFDRKDRAA